MIVFMYDNANTRSSLYNNEGIVKCKQGQLNFGIADFNTAILYNRESPYAYHNRGLAKTMLGEFRSARIDLEKASKLFNEMRLCQSYFIPKYLISNNSALTDLCNNSGVAKCERGHLVAGIEDFDLAIYLDLNNTIAYYNRGLAKKQMGQTHSGDADWQKVREI